MRHGAMPQKKVVITTQIETVMDKPLLFNFIKNTPEIHLRKGNRWSLDLLARSESKAFTTTYLDDPSFGAKRIRQNRVANNWVCIGKWFTSLHCQWKDKVISTIANNNISLPFC